MKTCLFCGMEISENAKSCKYCGSDENTGWSDSIYLDGIDLNDDFDYEDALDEEFGTGKKKHKGNFWVTITATIFIGTVLVISVIANFF